jgi:hypothetical protein
MVVEPQERAITQAYAVLKRLARGVDTLAVGICVAGADDVAARLLITRFSDVAASQLGIQVQAISSLGDALSLAGNEGKEARGGANQSFAENLLSQARNVTTSAMSFGRAPAMAWQ